MKIQLLLVFIFLSLYSNAEENYKIYYEEAEYGYDIFVDNNHFCPISIKVNFSTTNLSIEKGNDKIYIIEPNKKRKLITKLIVVNKRKGYKFSYKYSKNIGNVTQEIYDEGFEYLLPFETGKSFLVFQGYNGSFSHQNKNALDFSMPIGTKITAIRSGIVVKIVKKNNKNCDKKECAKYNNYIIIYHKDGTFAEYTHIKKNGAKVKIGDIVKQGQTIGFSGNVGWSNGPHLHLVVYLQKMKSRKTLKTKFITAKNISTILKEKESYKRN